MYTLNKLVILTAFVCNLIVVNAQVVTHYSQQDQQQIFTLSNNKVKQQVVIHHGILQSDELKAQTNWLVSYQNTKQHAVYTDGDFEIQMMWTDWKAPGKDFNGDLQVTFSKNDFLLQHYVFEDVPKGKKLILYFSPLNKENTLQLRITYLLFDEAFYAKRQLALRDTLLQKNWIEAFESRKGNVYSENTSNNGYSMREESSTTEQFITLQQQQQGETNTIIKKGDFGQPCAIQLNGGGVFFGIEYPAANTSVTRNSNLQLQLQCKELIGKVVQKNWIESSWVVEGLAPNNAVQDWFYNYVSEIKVAPNKPYALYNSWYDLRSPSYPGVATNHVMNEKNVLHIIDLFKENMTDKYGIHLNAFVLDDGWDVYESNWLLNKATFPNGLQPIVQALKPMGTTLGIWLGPTGGYSFRMQRIKWMKDHGYETVGTTTNDAMLDIAGTNYSHLFEQRITDFAKQGVGYFKWDGIQFASSENNSGHAVGYHSRRAAVQSIIEKCKAVRAINPNEYINITSGTWLSPWWLQYANQIWMQGADYGYANTPVINDRDAAMTYKDIVLYDDFKRQDVWFPISNMMTHGIIKGNLATIGGNDDPLAKFSDDVVFYFARGVTMYELYLSPDLLQPKEWKVLSQSIHWAKQHFSWLDKTYMVGGNPMNGNAYGFVHFKESSGIIAVRNPRIESQQLTINLSTMYGMADTAASLVLERVYPNHWISPNLYAAGATIVLPSLQGFEVAVYKIYPLQNADKPLLANAIMQPLKQNAHSQHWQLLNTTGKLMLLNPWLVDGITVDGKKQNINNISIDNNFNPTPIATNVLIHTNTINGALTVNNKNITTRIVVMLQPDSTNIEQPFPDIEWVLNGEKIKPTIQQQDGHWGSYSFVFNTIGKQTFQFKINGNKKTKQWRGIASVWAIAQQRGHSNNIVITTHRAVQNELMLPNPYEEGTLQSTFLLASGVIEL